MPDLTNPITGEVLKDDPNFPIPPAADRSNGRAGIIAPLPGPWSGATYALSTNVIRMSRCVPSRDILATKVAIAVTTAAGSADPIDIGIFDITGKRLASTGSVQPATGGDLTTTGVKVYNLTSSVLLKAGTPFYVGIDSPAPITTAAQVAAVSMNTAAGLAFLYGSAAGTTEMDSVNQAPPIPANVVLTGNSGLATAAPVIAVRES